MVFIKINLNIVILAILLTVNPLGTGLAQHSADHHKSEPTSTQHHRLYDNSSTSTLSEAANNYYKRQYQTDDYYTDRYEKNKYSKDNDRYKDYNDQRSEKNYTNRYDDKYSNRNERSENYFRIDRSGRTLWDGKHWEITDFPLKIFVNESASKYYKSAYKDYVSYAMNVWRKADDRINYVLVDSKKDADIGLFFIEDLGEKYREDYLGLTEYEMGRNKVIDYSKIQISLIKFGDEPVSPGEIKATIIHELGHALGLGHSNNEYDIMYPYIDPDSPTDMNYGELSYGDKEAIKDAIDLGETEFYVNK